MSNSHKRTKTAQLNFKVDAQLKELSERCAADDSRSLTSLVESLLYGVLRERGYLPPVSANLQAR